jgi:hypothetical protein
MEQEKKPNQVDPGQRKEQEQRKPGQSGQPGQQRQPDQQEQWKKPGQTDERKPEKREDVA